MHSNIPGRTQIPLKDYHENLAWYYPNCEMETKGWFVDHAQADWVYLDIGANIGYYSILFSQLSPQGWIHALEPTSTADMLKGNLQHNHCSNVSVHPVAAGKRSGPKEDKIFRIRGQEPEVSTYDFVTIDSFVTDHKLTRVDCLKIDVDSYGFEVLQGSEETLKRFDPWLVVELNHDLGQRGQSNIAALDWLLTRGYKNILVLDHDNFILKRNAPSEFFATRRTMVLNFSKAKRVGRGGVFERIGRYVARKFRAAIKTRIFKGLSFTQRYHRDSHEMHTRIPDRNAIKLPAYYDSFSWYYPNCELETKGWFVKNAQPDWVYLDCGANIGYYSILFSQLSPKGWVHAIEPTSTARMLETNLKHNQCDNVSVHQVAVGKHPGSQEDRIFRIWGQEPEVKVYDFVTIDSFVADHNLSHVDCIKIDVDSYDFEVLQGAEVTLDRFDPWLVVELNDGLGQRGQSNVAALDWLLARGYQHCIVLDHDNFILKRSAPPEAFATPRSMVLNFPESK